MVDSVLFSSQKHDWATPQLLFNRFDEHFKFTLDCAANSSNTKVSRWLGPGSSFAEDALTTDWGSNERFWLNSPYGYALNTWSFKAISEVKKLFCNNTLVSLVPARTETRWFKTYYKNSDYLIFLEKRLTFEGAKQNAPFPSAVFIAGTNKQQREGLIEKFSDLGLVIDLSKTSRGVLIKPYETSY